MDLSLPLLDDSVRPIYLDNSGELYCVVDLEDYDFAMQWKWKPVKSRGKKIKFYAFRTTRFQGRHVAFFLHKLICLRHRGLPPTPEHTIGDHGDGDSLNNRRINLDWTTLSGNRRSRQGAGPGTGIAHQQLRMAVVTQDISRVVSGRNKVLS